ncbi:hypothetical protein, partial [Serratia fonticola]
QMYFHVDELDPHREQNQASSMITGIDLNISRDAGLIDIMPFNLEGNLEVRQINAHAIIIQQL